MHLDGPKSFLDDFLFCFSNASLQQRRFSAAFSIPEELFFSKRTTMIVFQRLSIESFDNPLPSCCPDSSHRWGAACFVRISGFFSVPWPVADWDRYNGEMVDDSFY